MPANRAALRDQERRSPDGMDFCSDTNAAEDPEFLIPLSYVENDTVRRVEENMTDTDIRVLCWPFQLTCQTR